MDNRVVSVRLSGKLLNWYDTLEKGKSEVIRMAIREFIETSGYNKENYKLVSKSKDEANKTEQLERDQPEKSLKWDFPKI